ncbi:hypothetical protein LEM8419_00601 [Neolewinella maritima]|uniref:PKD domain-containing protein n=1 Tax=Neolewinella maritima TaxID=1383882 RepID=A0ABM9AXN4_9BACT|nr:PKD domain-containing protein [Neolewinella maritima]CAH0999303.1 hypothetical protein LEM8419_00601 [Neolewinella maritima]
MKNFYLASVLVVSLMLTFQQANAQLSVSASGIPFLMEVAEASTAEQAITLQAGQPYYFSTAFQIDAISSSWTDRILTGLLMDDQISGDQWVYPQLVRRGDAVFVEVRATDLADNGVERRVPFGQPQQLIIRGVWDGSFAVTYSWTLSPTPTAEDNDWTEIGYHFVWGQPILSSLYRNTTYDADITGTLGTVRVVLDYEQVAPDGPVAPTNNAPVLEQIGDVATTEGEVTTITLRATDEDTDDRLTFSASAALPAFASLTDNGDRTATLRVAPSVGEAGTYAGIVVTVSDGELSSSETISLVVDAAPVVSGCPPISILPCEDVAVALPLKFSFNGDENGIYDRNGQGIGFTMVDAPSNNLFPATPTNPNVPGMEPSLLTVVGGKLVVTSTKGINYQRPAVSANTNSQVNALGVGISAPARAFAVSVDLTQPNFDASAGANSQQGGLWYGLGEDNYIKLVAIKSASGLQRIQLMVETIDPTDATAVVLSSLTTEEFASTAQVLRLELVLNPVARTVAATYVVNSGTAIPVTEDGVGTLAVPVSFITGTDHDGQAGTPRLSYAGVFTSHRNAAAADAIDFAFDNFAIGEVASSGVPRVTAVLPRDGAVGVSPSTSVSANELFLPNGRNGVFGVDNSTISPQTVRLFKLPSNTAVPATTNGTGGGDAINLTPLFPLEANTTYRFEVDGVKDLTGVAFAAFSSTFTTSTGVTGGGGDLDAVSFTSGGKVATQARYTSLEIGPDGRLYGLSIDGVVDRFDVADDGTLSGKTSITTLTDTYGSRSAVGFTFSPDATADKLLAFVSHCSGGLTNAPAWDGKISQLSGPDLGTEQLVVTNLPRSRRDHLTNSITFREGQPNVLYFLQGSNTAGGAPDNAWGNRLERLLSAASLRLDLNKLPQNTWPLNAKTTMSAAAINAADTNSPTLGSGTGTYRENNQTFPDDGTYNPYFRDAPLTLYATGIRNAFDLVWHSNGQLYIPTNGTNGGSNSPASVDGTRRPDGTVYRYDDAAGRYPAIPAVTGNNTQRDYLFRVDPASTIGFYGHPNPLRGEFVLNGGTGEVSTYPTGILPDVNFRGPAFNFEFNKSPNGVIEYRSNAENGNLRGALLVCRYSGGSDIMALLPDGPNGDIATVKVGIPGFTGFTDPLDIVEDVRTGNLYVSDFGTQSITLLRPSNQATRRPFLTVDKTRILAEEIVSAPSGKQTTVFLTNSGNAVLEGATATITGANAADFTLTMGNFPASLGVNSTTSVQVSFTPSTAGAKVATLTFAGTNAEPVVVALRGLGKKGLGGSNEPSLQQILDTYGLPVQVGDQNPATTALDLAAGKTYDDLLGDELSLQQFQRAGNGNVTVEVLAVYGPEANDPIVSFGWYDGNATNSNELFSVRNDVAGNGQTVTPRVSGNLSFNPGVATFGFYSRWPYFNNRTLYSEDALNTFSGALPHHVRVYQVPGEENAYIVATEEHINTPDYQDIVVLVRNVAPAGAPLATASPEELLFEATVNTEGKQTDTKTVTITNAGQTELLIGEVRLTGPYADQFSVTGPSNNSLAPAAAQDYTVTYTPDLNQDNLGYQGAELSIETNGVTDGNFRIGLHALKKAGFEGGQEPALQAVVNTLGLGIDVGWTTLTTTTAATVQGQEVIAPLFAAAGSGPVGIASVARYSPAETLPFGVYTNAGGTVTTTQVGVQAGGIVNAQTLYPRLASGSSSFTAPAAPFGVYVESKTFNRINYTQDELNTGIAHRSRVYPVRDRSGQLVENSYLVCFEDATNGDYQDYVFLLTNVKPAGAGAQVLSFAPARIDLEAARGQVSAPARTQLIASVAPVGTPIRLTSDADWVVLPTDVRIGEPLTFAANAYTLADGTYTATVTATASGYAPAKLAVTATVSGTVIVAARINFQDNTFTPPAGYLADVGEAYGIRPGGKTYGWINPDTKQPQDNLISARGAARGVTNTSTTEDKLLRSFAMLDQIDLSPRAPRDWEIEVPNGTYRVEVTAGDPQYYNSLHFLRAEGVVLIKNFVPTATDVYRTASATVRVLDGKLTIDDTGAYNTGNSKIVALSYTKIDGATALPTIIADVSGFQTASGAYAGEATVTLRAQDESGSGIQSLGYSVNGAAFVAYSAPINLQLPVGTSSADYRLVARATDGNGNTATKEITLRLERATGAVLRIENMTKLPGTSRGFPAEDYFSFHYNNVVKLYDGERPRVHDSNVMRIHNDGTAPLRITALTSTDESLFTISGLNVAAGGLEIAPGSYADATVTFVARDLAGAKLILREQLVLTSNADNPAAAKVTFSGSYSQFIEGGNEITTQQVFDVFGFQTTMGRDENNQLVTNPSSDYPTYDRVDSGKEGSLILSPYFVQADASKPVQMIHIGSFQGYSTPTAQLQNASNQTVGGMNYGMGRLWFQSILPKSSNTSTILAGDRTDRITEPFQIRIAGYRSTGGTSRNTLKNEILGIRVYKVIDHHGNVIPNDYIVLHDYIGTGCAAGSGNCDWQDNAAYLTNVRPFNTPSASAIADVRVDPGVVRSYGVATAFDKGYAGNDLTYSATLSNGTPLPKWIELDGRTAEFVINAPYSAASTSSTVRVTATDLNGLMTSSTFRLIVASSDLDCAISANADGQTKTIFCEGGSVQLNGRTSTGVYKWTGPNGFTSAAANPVVSVPGVYTLTSETLLYGTCPGTSSVTVNTDYGNAPSLRIAAATSTLTCSVGSIELTAVSGALSPSYYWYDGDRLIGTGRRQVVTRAGNYRISAVGTDGCTATSSIIITENLTPALPGTGGDIAVCRFEAGFSLYAQLLTFGGSPQLGGQWTLYGSPVPDAFDPATASSGVYTYTVGGANASCTKASSTLIVVITEAARYYRDADGDGFGNMDAAKLLCAPEDGFVSNASDCDDADPSVHPGAAELCDGKDNDCDGTVDEGDACTGSATAIRINAGGPTTDNQGSTFRADQYFLDGNSYLNANNSLPAIYQTERTAGSPYVLRYALPLADGAYTVRLHFAEIYWGAIGAGGTGRRIFDVRLEGQLVQDNYDIIADVGSLTAVVKEYRVTMTDGTLNLRLDASSGVGGVNQPKLSALEILPLGGGTGPNTAPVAIATASPQSGPAPLSVNLDGTTSYDDGGIASYAWQWTGGSATGPSARVNFREGMYAVTLTVTDQQGLTGTDVVNLTVGRNILDNDGDGVEDSADNCPFVANPDQQLPRFYADGDRDGYGDPATFVEACTAPAGYVDNALDNCPSVYSLDLTDTDEDGIGDVCDEDSDNDGVRDADDCDPRDARIGAAKLYYADQDGDGFGDPAQAVLACTVPTGYVLDNTDNCPAQSNPDQVDTNGNGRGDVCDGAVAAKSSFWLEAECARVGSVWTVRTDATASGSKYVDALGNTDLNNVPADQPANHVTFVIDQAEAGVYNLFARISAANGDSDSYWVRVNNGAWYKWSGGIVVDNTFHWNKMRVSVDLLAGANSIDFAWREGPARLDKLHLTKGATVPTLLGEEATNCGTRTNQPPVARATATPTEGAAPLRVSLDAKGSFDTDGTIATYAWNWAGGSTTGATASATFPAGTYTVTLTVIDQQGGAGTTQLSIRSLNPNADTDGDGIIDAEDNCPLTANPDQVIPTFYADRDGDGLGNPAESVQACVQPAGFVSNQRDNCPTLNSSDLTDTDEDGLGDACDPDDDNDGIADAEDCAPLDATIGRGTRYYRDQDDDGFGDPASSLRSCSAVAGYVLNNTDNCPLTANPGQEDSDGNGIGDACEGVTYTKSVFWLEAECGIVGSAWTNFTDATASGETYVASPGNNTLGAPPADTDANRVRFIVADTEAGSYNLFARISALNGDTDSYWVRVNNGAWYKWSGGIQTTNTFNWNRMRELVVLKQGSNVVDFAWREGGAKLDKLHLKLDATLPSGLGSLADNCGVAVNAPPVARASSSVSEGASPLSVQLDGSRSSDPDGSIESYAWTWAGGSASGATPRVSFTTGTYTVRLTVTDDQGATGTSQLTITAFDPTQDTDGDGVADAEDNCPTVANPDQQLFTYYADFDGDGLGDPADAVQACEQPADFVANADDNCPANYSLDTTDSDGDGIGDACDNFDGASTDFSLEAECARIGSGWRIQQAADASGGRFTNFIGAADYNATSVGDPGQQLNFDVTVNEAATFYLFLRLDAPDGARNSLWVRIDDGKWLKFWKGSDGKQILTTGFEWRKVSDDAAPVSFALSAGAHTITVANREPGTLVDKVLLSNLDARPTGTGLAATNCSTAKALTTAATLQRSEPTDVEDLHVALFPNPAREQLTVDLRSGYTGRVEVIITDATGRRVKQFFVDKTSELHRMRLEVSVLTSGMYQLQVIEDDRQVIKQFVKLR